MARRYARDRKGRFSSTGATARGGRLTSAAGKRYTTQTKRAAGAAPSGTIRPGKSKKRSGLDAASNIRPLTRGATGAPRALRANAVRAFSPKSPRLRAGQLGRQIQKTVKSLPPSNKEKLQTAKGRLSAISRRMDRLSARDIADRASKDAGRRIVSEIGRSTVSGRRGSNVIQERAQRAASAAARGSKPAARAVKIYDEQLAYTGKGRAKAAKSNLRPGPRNTAGEPPKRRKPRRK